MPEHDVQWHLQELARRVMAQPGERLRLIREYHADLVAAGDTFTANVILTVRSIVTDRGDTPPVEPVPVVTARPFWRARRALWWIGVPVMLGVVLLFIFNRGFVSVDRSPFEIQADYLGTEAHKKPLAVVFVHGIFGSKDDTWVNKATSFPGLLATDPDLHDRTDVFLFEYYTPKFGDAASIVGLADQLRGSLEDHHVFEDHERVVFLSHSMGGIVVRQFLLTNRQYVTKVSMLFFYATPTNGAELTVAARYLSNNPQLRGMLPLEGNDLLQSIQSGWLGWEEAKHIPSHCAYETLPTYGIIVVPLASATALCNQTPDPMSANHIDIVKPKDRNEQRYSRFATALRGVVAASTTGEGSAPRVTSAALGFDASNQTSSFPIEGHFTGTVTRSQSALRVAVETATLLLRRIDAFPNAPAEVNVILVRVGITRITGNRWDIVRASADYPIQQTLQLDSPPVHLSPLTATIPLSGLALEPNDALIIAIVSGHPRKGDLGETYVHINPPLPSN